MRKYCLGCSNKRCWYTYYLVLTPEESINQYCPRCNSKSEVLKDFDF